MQIEPYLFFEGRCEEALEFYKNALGAEVTMLMRFKDSPDQEACPVDDDNKIMHAAFKIGESPVMASDGHCGGNPSFQGISLSIGLTDVTDAEKKFNALADGGEVVMPLEKTFWSPSFGVVNDKFGISWMINVME
ncbi:VOC family protein [Kaarinaea lacus]